MPRAREDTAPVTVDSPFYRGKTVQLGDVTVMFESFPEEQDATPFFRGLPDDRCPCPHWGLVVSGSWIAHYRDHDETFEAGDVFYSPPRSSALMHSGHRAHHLQPDARAGRGHGRDRQERGTAQRGCSDMTKERDSTREVSL
jgi:hypothetical protein